MNRRKEAGNIWLIIFSDITTNLMLFFLMMFAMTRMSSSEKEMVAAGMESTLINRSARAEADRDRLIKKRKEENAIQGLNNAIAHGKLSGKAHMAIDDKTVKITLNPEVFFESGNANMNLDTKNTLEDLVKPLGEFPNDIIIEGHTDNVPIRGGLYGSNWELSVSRAVSVIDFFVVHGLNPLQLVAGGYGEYHPSFPNDTPENRARNRRIEVTILRQQGRM